MNAFEHGESRRPGPATLSVPEPSSPQWCQRDLVKRLRLALDFAHQMIGTVDAAAALTAVAEANAEVTCERLRGKVVAETAMLLLCVAPVAHLDDALPVQSRLLALRLIPYARGEEVLLGICMEPGMAREYAVAHAILSRLGYPDQRVDDLLRQSISPDPELGPERLPHRRLEHEWLARVWNALAIRRCDESRLVSESMLGRTLDALGASRFDIYAFTHAVMYATDLGARALSSMRSTHAIAADADAALAFSLETDDYDLTAEILLTWPMLRLQWSAAATFAFSVLTGLQDRLGFLPGNAFDEAHHAELQHGERTRFALATSYHTAYVMGFLCAAALAPGCAPAASPLRISTSTGAADRLLALLGESTSRCWRVAIDALGAQEREALAPLLLTMAIRRAKAAGSVERLQESLEVALSHELFEAPAPLQAAALLGRLRFLAE